MCGINKNRSTNNLFEQFEREKKNQQNTFHSNEQKHDHLL